MVNEPLVVVALAGELGAEIIDLLSDLFLILELFS